MSLIVWWYFGLDWWLWWALGPVILLLEYPLAIQVERGGVWLVLAPLTLIALWADIVANYTTLALLTWDLPAKGEYTFSTRVKRLQYYPGWRGKFARLVRDYTNFFDPQGDHI